MTDDAEQRRDRTAAAGERRRDATADRSETRRATAMADELGALEANNARLDEVIRLLMGVPDDPDNNGLMSDLAETKAGLVDERVGRRRSVWLLAVSLILDVALSVTTVFLVVQQHHTDQRTRTEAATATYNNALDLYNNCNAGNDTRATIQASFNVIYTLFLQNPSTTQATRDGIAEIEQAQAKVLNQRPCGPEPRRPSR